MTEETYMDFDVLVQIRKLLCSCTLLAQDVYKWTLYFLDQNMNALSTFKIIKV